MKIINKFKINSAYKFYLVRYKRIYNFIINYKLKYNLHKNFKFKKRILHVKNEINKNPVYLEKFNINKVFLNIQLNTKYKNIFIQENLSNKNLSISKVSRLKTVFIKPYSNVYNLHNYIIKFPVSNNKLYNLKTSFFRELNFQLYKLILKNTNYLNFRSNFINKSKTQYKLGLDVLESLFEMIENITDIFIINSNIGCILDFKYYNNTNVLIKIPIINILYNIQVLKTQKYINYNIETLITNTKLVFGGDVLTTGNIVFQNLIYKQFLSNIENTNLYRSAKLSLSTGFNLLLETLITQFEFQGIFLPYILFEIITTRMASYVKIIDNGYTSLIINDVISLEIVQLVNKSFYTHGFLGSIYTPILIGVSNIVLGNSGLLATISFQETLKTLSSLTLKMQMDWLLDLKSKIITSELLESGTGWYKRFIKNNR